MAKVASGKNTDEFAVIATGGKQYKVSVGEVISIETMKNKDGVLFKEGDKVTFDNVLMVDNGKESTIGVPYIKEAKVEGIVKTVGKKPKIVVVKYKAKSRYLKTRGHRQPFFAVEITGLK